MQLTLDRINRNEVLQYLGWSGSEIPDDVDALIDGCIADALREADPKFIWKKFEISRENGLSLPAAGLMLPGESVKELLTDCTSCVLLAVTLGNGMDRAITRAKGRDLTRSVVLDTCGSAGVEAACDRAEEEIRAALGGEVYFTDRFSPGYGDLPLELQRSVLNALDAGRKIGLTLTESCIMLPRKSVTAVIGLADKPQKKRFRGCAYCSMFERCTYRKAKKYCGRV